MNKRAILHSDANCFYASCEMVLNPDLREKAVAVCGSSEERHGIVLAKSEKAKKAGITTGMTNSEALKLCPDLIIVPPRFEYYSKFSKLLHKIYERYTDLIEPYGLDECWLDVSDSIKSPYEIAEEIRQAVKDELGLTVSIGVSFNKVFAKLGSDLKKPDAITVISEADFKSKIWPLPCSDLLYCGRQTTEKLHSFGVKTIGQLASLPRDFIEGRLGKNGILIWEFANGLDTSPVAHMNDKVQAKSIGHGITCIENLVNNDEAKKVIVSLSQDVGYKLRKSGLCARGVSLTIKNELLVSTSYQARVDNPIWDEVSLANEAYKLLEKNYNWSFNVRAISVTAIDLVSNDVPIQASVFFDNDKEEKKKRLFKAIDDVNNAYGKGVLKPATVLDEKKMPKHKNVEVTLPGGMKLK